VSAMVRRALLAVLALTAALLVALPAGGVVVCAFDEPTGTVTITLDNGDVARVVRQGDAITVAGAPCDTATVLNTDTINASSTGTAATVEIDLSGGPFAPGETAEADAADSEIEWLVNLLAGSTLRVLGSSGPDDVVVGADGINLDATEANDDVDVVVTGGPTVVLSGADGADALSAAGGAGTGGAGPVATLQGDEANDVLTPGSPGSTVNGGAGSDTADYRASGGGVEVDLAAGTARIGGGTDTLAGIENAIGTPGDDVLVGDGGANSLDGIAGDDRIAGGPGDDTLIGGAGSDLLDYAGAGSAVTVDLGEGTATGHGTDDVSEFEEVRGSDQADRLEGNGQVNELDGGAGDDRLDGAGAPDDLRGGTGNDTVLYGASPRHVEVDLREGTATGFGSDTLAGIENVEGSPKDDIIHGSDTANVLDGRAGLDEISGHVGKDRVVGGVGSDLLSGHEGNDVLLGLGGKDQLNGGDGNDDVCRGGEDADSYVLCENFRTAVDRARAL
jgi:Ca2+-binding RTX toxin-like protein